MSRPPRAFRHVLVHAAHPNVGVAKPANHGGPPMSGPLQQRRALGILVTAIVTLCLTSPSAQGPATLPLASVTYFGGVGDQRAHAVSMHGGAVYISGSDGDPSHPDGLLLRYDLPPGDAPAWSRTFDFESPLPGISARSEGLYAAGHSLELTEDFVDAKDTKSLVAQFPLDGSTGGAPGGANWVTGGPGSLGAFFAADRLEQFRAIVTATEGGVPVVYAAGRADPGCPPSSYIVAKYDAAGAFLGAATDSSSGVSFAGCGAPGLSLHSDAMGIAMLNGNIYLAGVGDWPDDANKPTVWKYDSHLNLQWRSTVPVQHNSFTSVAAIGGALYAVGSNFGSALIAKFDENGTLLRSGPVGLGITGGLTGVVGVGTRVFAVGYRTEFQGSSHDGVVFEFDPQSLQIMSMTPFGSANDDDKLTAVATDGIDLYAVGESRRPVLGSPGDYDVVLARYELGTPEDTTPPGTTARTHPEPNAAGWNNTPVGVTLIGNDGGGVGVSSITYFPYGEPPIVAEGSSTTFELSDDAVKTINYYATDLAGNIQPLINLLTVRIDKIAPATAVDIAPFLPPSGWYRELPHVRLTPGDTGGSGLASLTYRIGTGAPVTGPPFSVSLPASPEGITTAFFSAADVAGNLEPEQSLTLQVDRTPPVTAASTSPATNVLWNNTDVDVTLQATDGVGSGAESILYRITRPFPSPVVTGPLVTVPGDTAAFAVSLEGQVNLQYWATDVAGWIEAPHELTFHIDKTPPTFPAPPDVVRWEATGPDGDIVHFTVFTEDPISGVELGTLQVSHPSGSLFPFGATTVTLQVRDRAGNLGTRQFTVLVEDTRPPDFFTPAQPPQEATGPDGAAVSFNFSALDVVDGPVPVICDRTSGSVFPIGRTIMNCSTTDSHGNTIRREIPIDVRDTTPPSLTLPPDFVGLEATSAQGRQVSFAASATDIVDGGRPVTCVPASGSSFPIGTTTVACTAQDTRGNVRTGSFTIHVQDTTPPTLVFGAPAPGANAAGWHNSNVTMGFTVADNGPGPLVTSLPSPLVFSTDGAGLRQTVVVTDQAGNSATFTSPAVALDKTPPVVSYLGNAGTYTVDQQVEIRCIASDSLSGVASTTCADISGPALAFALGVNGYTADAADRAGNVGHGAASFTVTVTSASLGALVTQFSAGGGVATGLIAKLDAAAAASNVTARNGLLTAFINEVNAQIGNAFTAEQAQILTGFASALLQ